MMIAGLSLTMVVHAMLPVAERLPASWQQGWLLATPVLYGLCTTLCMVNRPVFLMGVTGPEERTHAFSLLMALAPVAGTAGSLVGGLLPVLFARAFGLCAHEPASYRYPLLIAAGLLAPGVLALRSASDVPATPTREGAASRGSAPWGPISLMASVVMLRLAEHPAINAFFNVYLDPVLRAAPAVIGALTAAGHLLAALGALATPLGVMRWGNSTASVLGSLGMALGLLPLALIPHWGIAGLGYVGMMLLSSTTAVDSAVQRWP
jgi:hypothetical protein